jgi:Dolichyl-phosphate-mannose-protein mannosyltransferase
VWVGLALVLLVAFLIRWRLRECPLERDEGEYAYLGQLLLDGVPPYGMAGNHKFPGAYIAYAAIMAVFGQTTAGIHLGMLVVNLASTVLLFFLGRRVTGNAGGLAAAAAWVVMSVSPGVFGNAGHLTHFVMLAVLGGLLLLWRALETGNTWCLWAGGICLGLSVVVRQTSLVFVLFGLVFFWLAARQSMKHHAAKRAAIVALASTIPVIAMAVWLWLAGVWPQFWRWTFTEAIAYGSEMSLGDGLGQFFRATPPIIGWNFLIWVGAAAGLAIALVDKSRRSWFLAGFFVTGFVAIFPGLYFREHYYIQVLPAVALLFGLAVERVWALRSGWRYAATAGSIAAVLLPVITQRSYFLELPPTGVSRYVYGGNPFPEAIEVARYLEANSAPGERIAVLGSEPQIFFYARRRAATSLIYTYPLMEHHRFAHDLQETMAREIEQASPKFIVFVTAPTSWLEHPDSDRFIFEWADKFLAREYQLDGVADILAEGSKYVWGPGAATYQVQSPYYLSVYRRTNY